MKLAVFGANGQLGRDITYLAAAMGHVVCEINHADVDARDGDAVRRAVSRAEPDVVVNAAALHHVEACEARPDEAFAVNAVGAKHVAIAAEAAKALMVYISTDYVFDGAKGYPYVETDLPSPLNVYGATKLAGEHFVRAHSARHVILRVSALYGRFPCRGKGLNFVELMLRLAAQRGRLRVVDNEIVTPTSTLDVARQIVRAVEADVRGICHATAEGSCSWHEFAREIVALAGLRVPVDVAAPDEFQAKVPRPRYSVLENGTLKSLGLNVFPDWRDALREYLAMRACPAAAEER